MNICKEFKGPVKLIEKKRSLKWGIIYRFTDLNLKKDRIS